ncbi:hypothetical protein [Nocardioides sp.]|uniref:hypothetical protein n=1 Tax=Nocardioides sp. TaxID=35761 RepID=UPI003784A090
MILDTTLAPYAVAFLVLALVATVTAIAVIGDLLVRNRRQRLARHESIPTYYRGLIASH